LDGAGTVIVPGSPDIDAPPPALVVAVRRAHADGKRIASICSGVFVLAAAGLLDGRRAAVHWANAETLARRYPQITVDPAVLYVDEGNILTSAGRAAGLDLCLHIVRRDYGIEIANQAARRLIVAPHRSGGQAQFIPRPVPNEGDRLGDVLAWARRNLDQDLTIDRLAAQARMSRRTLIRRVGLAGTPRRGLPRARNDAAVGRTDRRRRRSRLGRYPTPSVPHPARHQSGPLPVLLRGVETRFSAEVMPGRAGRLLFR